MKTYSCVVHRGIEDVDIFHNIELPLILPERANRDTMRAVTPHILHQNVGAIRLERHTILRIVSKSLPLNSGTLAISVVHHRVLDHKIRASVCIPTICIFCHIDGGTVPGDVYIIKDDIRGIGHEVVIFG